MSIMPRQQAADWHKAKPKVPDAVHDSLKRPLVADVISHPSRSRQFKDGQIPTVERPMSRKINSYMGAKNA